MKQVPATGAVFTGDDLLDHYLTSGAKVVKRDPKSKRTIKYSLDERSRHRLEIEGPGVPGSIEIACDNNYVNVIARMLLEHKYDGKLVGHWGLPTVRR